MLLGVLIFASYFEEIFGWHKQKKKQNESTIFVVGSYSFSTGIQCSDFIGILT